METILFVCWLLIAAPAAVCLTAIACGMVNDDKNQMAVNAVAVYLALVVVTAVLTTARFAGVV